MKRWNMFPENLFRNMSVKMYLLKDALLSEQGQDLIEYALIGLIIALGALSGMGKLASSLNKEFTKIASSLT